MVIFSWCLVFQINTKLLTFLVNTAMAPNKSFQRTPQKLRFCSAVSFPRNFVFQEMGYNAPTDWKEKCS